MPGSSVLHHLLELLSFMSIELVMASNHLILCHLLLLLPSVFPSIRVFSSSGLVSVNPEISPEYSFEGLMLKLKLQDFNHLMRRTGLI